MKAFNEIHCLVFFEARKSIITKEIKSNTKEYILGVDENEYKAYLFEKYFLEPLSIDKSSEEILEPKKINLKTEDWYNRTVTTEAYKFTIKYKYAGSTEIFKVRPSTWFMTSDEIEIFDNRVSIEFSISKLDPSEFERLKSQCFKDAFCNLQHANNDAIKWNSQLKGFINDAFSTEKNKYLAENNFFAAINLKQNKSTALYSVPTITKKVIPQPTIGTNKEFSSEPIISQSLYQDILRLIYDNGKNIEKKPSLYENKDEEALRDQFLLFLETRYEGVAVTGEAFNRSGKTDILLKYANDGSNLFVAECKIWKGIVEFQNAISQLFDRYLTWRDSKTALIVFVKNKDMVNIINTVKKEIANHPYYIKANGFRGETSFSYIFHLPQDKLKEVQLEVMFFHYDK